MKHINKLQYYTQDSFHSMLIYIIKLFSNEYLNVYMLAIAVQTAGIC